ncbi:PREDICTED: contactin-5-like [Branchiostoma belcheri]|uniref:Contactin-5-like n=1 Tax=Branchiostoma belcheri TaxID=7741 RepID=A0A6P4Z6N2_BRABE|nr:PREDICTED: contactin-5-like [Branchiostoma belcheri]
MWISVILAITCTGLGTTGAPLHPAQVIAPKLTIEPTDVVINPSSGITSVSFQCRATGDPVPQYLWFKEYVDLDTMNRQPPFQTSGGTLTIPVPTATDQGRYWCQAYNEYGRVVSIGANLTFAFVDNFDSGPRPVVTTTSGNGTLLQCMQPNAYPSLVYHWIEAGQTSFIAHTVRRYASQKNGDYYFANVSPDDNGLYQCGVKINLNTALTEPAATGGFNEFSPETQLTVNAATPTKVRAASLASWRSESVQVGESLQFLIRCCRVWGSSPQLQAALFDFPHRSRLQLSAVLATFALARFRATQDLLGMSAPGGRDSLGAPGKVSNLKLVEKGDNSATLSWSEPPTKAELTGYQIQYYPTDNPDNVQYMDVRAKTVDGIYGPYSDPLVNGKIGPVDTGRATGGGGVPLVVWLLPLLLLLIPLLLLYETKYVIG